MAGKKRSGVGYEAIADILRTRITSGDLAPGEKVPSENDLMNDYGVGRDTASKVLGVLRDEGLTETRRGAPTRVRRFHPIRRSASARLSAEVWGAGASMWDVDVRDEKPQVLDVQVDRVDAPTRVAAALGVSRGTPVIRRSRRYALGNKPVLKAVSYLPADIADGTPIAEVDTGAGGIYARLADLGHRPAGFKEEIRVRMPSKEEKDSLDLGRGTPVIMIVRTASTDAGRVVEVNEMILDSASYILDYEISS